MGVVWWLHRRMVAHRRRRRWRSSFHFDRVTVNALKEIGRKLGKDWDLEQDPCHGWEIYNVGTRENNVTCNLEPNSTTCHVVSM
ncbi:hypothetical protein Hanom_Chr11g00983971 [Helianthus anomalus]